MDNTTDKQKEAWGWRQPIPTNLEVIFGEDYRCMQLFKELIYRANNKPNTTVTLKSGNNGSKTVILRKGQVLYGRKKFGLYLGWDDKTTDRALEKLQKVYNRVTMQRSRNYTVVTIQNYEDIIDVTKQMTNRRPSDDHPMTTSNSDNSDNSKEAAWNQYSPDLLKKYQIVDPFIINNLRLAYLGKGRRASQAAVAGFIRAGITDYQHRAPVTSRPRDEDIYPNVTAQRLEAQQ